MLLSELPKDTVVLYSETLIYMLVRRRTNRHLSLVAGLVDSSKIITLSTVRSEFCSFEEEWGDDGLDRVDVKSRTRALAETIGDMVELCQANGIDPFNPIVTAKLNLVGLARINDACVVSVDGRDNNMSMKAICDCFGVPFVAIDDIELN